MIINNFGLRALLSTFVWINLSVTGTFSNHCKWKHEHDTGKRSFDAFKKAKIEKQYHLTPAATDTDYGHEAITPIKITQEEIQHTCLQWIFTVFTSYNGTGFWTHHDIYKSRFTINSLLQQLRRPQLTASVFRTVIKHQKIWEISRDRNVQTTTQHSSSSRLGIITWGGCKMVVHKSQIDTIIQISKTGCTYISLTHLWRAASPNGVLGDLTQAKGDSPVVY